MSQETKFEKKHEEQPETLIRIMGYDIQGSKNVYTGLTKIKGISWAVSNAVCVKLNIPKFKKISELSKENVQQIELFMKELNIPNFLKNRQFDLETGSTKHYFGVDLEMRREFDIKRLMKIRSYRGIRHAAGLPVRGQKTRSHFRSKKNKKAIGIKKVKIKEKK